jgi:lysine-ketoglutarate reductase/saccharopine dehydrogenase-like protein (TIGR00300 family)
MIREEFELDPRPPGGGLLSGDHLARLLAAASAAGAVARVIDLTGDAKQARARLAVEAADPDRLDAALLALAPFGVRFAPVDARTAPAERDGILPDEFHATSNFDTFIRIAGRWQAVRDQKMDCAIVLRDGAPTCVKQRLVKRGEAVVLRGAGIRVSPPDLGGGATTFAFMSHEVSSEVNKDAVAGRIAAWMRETRAAGEKIVVVAGPAIVHSGGDGALARLIVAGWIDVVLAGNAFAAHDLEKALMGTSLGVCAKSGRAVEGGSRNHLATINAVNRAGGIAAAVESGLIRTGVMQACVSTATPFVLAGSIRDDGPLADVIPDVRDAQLAYLDALEGCGLCLMLATALHSIAVGNLLPARVRTVCVDMTESLPTKLANRGTLQAIGVVTDVGYLLERLAGRLLQHA